jgi:hypothetical protein
MPTMDRCLRSACGKVKSPYSPGQSGVHNSVRLVRLQLWRPNMSRGFLLGADPCDILGITGSNPVRLKSYVTSKDETLVSVTTRTYTKLSDFCSYSKQGGS